MQINNYPENPKAFDFMEFRYKERVIAKWLVLVNTYGNKPKKLLNIIIENNEIKIKDLPLLIFLYPIKRVGFHESRARRYSHSFGLIYSWFSIFHKSHPFFFIKISTTFTSVIFYERAYYKYWLFLWLLHWLNTMVSVSANIYT